MAGSAQLTRHKVDVVTIYHEGDSQWKIFALSQCPKHQDSWVTSHLSSRKKKAYNDFC